MGQLVIRVGTDGSLHTLLKDTVLDTSKFGDRKIDRITLIEFDEDEQKFFIKWLRGPYRPFTHTQGMARETLASDKYRLSADTIFFDTYEKAVEHEVECVNALRLEGERFDA